MLQFVFNNLQHLFISMARGLTYLNNIELLYPFDKFQRNWIMYREHTKQKHQFYRVADAIKVIFFFFFVSLLKIKFVWNSSNALLFFCLNKDNFWFLLMLRTSSAEVRQEKSQGNANCSPPKTVVNEIYLPYLQLWGMAFFLWIFM